MIHFNDAQHAAIIAKMAGAPYNPAVDVVISRSVNGQFLGGVIMTDWTGYGGSIGGHYAGTSKNWLSRDLVWCVYDYIFNQLACNKIFGRCPWNNQASADLLKKSGFKLEHVVADVFADGPLLVFGMYKSDCRFLKIKSRRLHSGS